MWLFPTEEPRTLCTIGRQPREAHNISSKSKVQAYALYLVLISTKNTALPPIGTAAKTAPALSAKNWGGFCSAPLPLPPSIGAVF